MAANGEVEEIDLETMIKAEIESSKDKFLAGFNALIRETGLSIRPLANIVHVSGDVFRVDKKLALVDKRGNVIEILEVQRDGA